MIDTCACRCKNVVQIVYIYVACVHTHTHQFLDGSSGLAISRGHMVGMWETKAPQLDVRLTDGQAQR